MLPRLSLGFVAIPSYAVLLVCALAVGVVLAVERGRRDGLSSRASWAPALCGIGAGLVGAHLWSLVFEVWPTANEASSSDAWRTGGLSVIGGLLLGALGAWAAVRWRRESMSAWLEAAGPSAAAAIAVGRIGCLLAGCCHGAPTLFPIALVYTDFAAAARPIGVPLHATQLYESIGCAALAVFLWYRPRGTRMPWLLAGYGALRAALELLRGDHRGYVLGWPPTLLAALAALVCGLAWLSVAIPRERAIRRRAQRTPSLPAA